MNFQEYQKAAMRTHDSKEEQTSSLVHAALGLASESGEFISEAKRIYAYGKYLSPEMIAHMREELGDILWYVALAAEALSTPMELLAQSNIDKLKLRYPDKFSFEAAEARADKGGLSHLES